MKYKIIAICCICTFAMSCNVLDQKPKTAVPSDHIIYNARSAQIALNGLYNKLQDVYDRDFYVLSDVSSDIVQSVGTLDRFRSADSYTMSVNNISVDWFWYAAYDAINQANIILAKVPTLDKVEQKIKDKILGQAHFIRGLVYFELNRSFGGMTNGYGTSMGVPLVLKPTTSGADVSYPSRAGLKEVYAQIESDLNKAIELLPKTSNNPTIATEGAAKALLSRLYLYYKQDYGKVEKYATDVIQGYNYELTKNFANIFIKEKTAGSIFELTFTNTDPSGLRGIYFPASLGGRGEVVLHKEFVQFLKSRSKDERADMIAKNSEGYYYPTKYQKVSGKDNIQIIRLAEMYLNRAEARVKKSPSDLSGALSDLNAIRNRAGLPDTTGAGVDQPKEILHAIAVERKVEFFEEGHRWFNLIRTGRALDVLVNVKRANTGAVSLKEAGRQVWPIPQQAMEANKNLKQNPFYK